MRSQVLDQATLRYGFALHGAGAVLVLMGMAVAFSLVYTPLVEGADDARNDIEQLRILMQDTPTIRTEHASLSERLSDVSARMDLLANRIPSEASVSEFVLQVTEAAEKYGTVISDFDAGAPVQEKSYTEQEIVFSGTSTYASTCRLLDHIRKLPRLTKVTKLEISSDTPGQLEYRMKLRVKIYYGLNVELQSTGEEASNG